MNNKETAMNNRHSRKVLVLIAALMVPAMCMMGSSSGAEENEKLSLEMATLHASIVTARLPRAAGRSRVHAACRAIWRTMARSRIKRNSI